MHNAVRECKSRLFDRAQTFASVEFQLQVLRRRRSREEQALEKFVRCHPLYAQVEQAELDASPTRLQGGLVCAFLGSMVHALESLLLLQLSRLKQTAAYKRYEILLCLVARLLSSSKPICHSAV